MNLLAKFVESLDGRVNIAAFREVAKPFFYDEVIEGRNIILQLNKGQMLVGDEETSVKPETFYFIPQGQKARVKNGKSKTFEKIEGGFRDDEHRKEYLPDISGLESWEKKNTVMSVVTFELILYNAFSFFPLIGMPPFQIPFDSEFAYLIKHICLENEQRKLGREIIMKNYMQEIVIHLCRYIDSQPKLKAHIEKLQYLTDKRLVDIVKYIQENLEKDLSNKAIANVAFVSEDYVGQFFKSLTNRNLQDYIENQRLERALKILKTFPDSVQEVSHRVGFKDPAYFSRRFKLKFGINANEVKMKRNQIV